MKIIRLTMLLLLSSTAIAGWAATDVAATSPTATTADAPVKVMPASAHSTAAAQSSSNQVIPINGIAAIVNDAVITQSELSQQVKFIKMQLSSQKGNLPSDSQLAKQVLNQMVNRQLQIAIAKRNKIVISDQQVSQALQQIATSSKGTVDQLYQQAAAYGVSQQYLRQQVKIQLMIETLQQKAMAAQIHISDQQIDNFIHQAVSNPQAKKQYHLKDILISLPNNPSPQQIQQAQDRAKVLVDRLNAGADFSKIALAQSDSQSTLENGGDLGWRAETELPSIFAQQVVKMTKGQIAGPIRSPNGYHIIKLVDVRGGSQAVKNVPQANIAQIILKPTAKRSSEKTLALAQQLEKELANGADFDQLAQKYSQGEHAADGGYVGWVSLDDNYPQALKEAINQVMSGQVSQLIIANQQYYLIKVIGKRQSANVNQTQRQQARQALLQQLMVEKLQSWIDQLKAQAYIKIMPPYNK